MSDSKDGRGWSLVFDDKTTPSGSADIEGIEQRTVIDDGRLGAELAEALDDPRLRNVDLSSSGLEFSDGPEQTIRADRPSFSVSQALDKGGAGPITKPFATLEAPVQPSADDTTPYRQADLRSLAMTLPELKMTSPSVDPLLEEATLPPPITPAPAGPLIGGPPARRTFVEPPLSQSPSYSRPVVPAGLGLRPSEEADKTDLDIAAALGMAPLAPVVGAPPLVAPPPRAQAEPKLADVLREVADEKRGKRRAQAVGRDGASPGDLQRVAVATDTVARIIPVLLVAFLLISAVLVSVKMLRPSEGSHPTHVELRFLPIGKEAGPAVLPSLNSTRLAIDTNPSGLLVLYKNEVLGRTPFLVDLPIELQGAVAAEVSSPYYEAWVGELSRDTPTGEYRITATLRPK